MYTSRHSTQSSFRKPPFMQILGGSTYPSRTPEGVVRNSAPCPFLLVPGQTVTVATLKDLHPSAMSSGRPDSQLLTLRPSFLLTEVSASRKVDARSSLAMQSRVSTVPGVIMRSSLTEMLDGE